ncbi:hypothetical protein HN680_01135, partial [Candidatus Peregrinibacteria bacterium]|nr:hypothetical protein [Candidatus Peregrinibacteria bacterium]
MKKWLTKIKNWIDNKGLIKILVPLAVLVIAIVVLPDIVGADEPSEASKKVEEVKANLVATVITFHAFLQALLYPVVMIASALMDNEILLSPEMESKILGIWVEIRNWVNIIFVLVLVGIALYNVMGVAGDGSNYALKAILPKIVIGLIAVNFSFLAVKLMIDSVGVLTEAVYALPTNFITWDSYADDLELRLCRSSESSTAEGEKVKDLGPKKVKDASVLGMIFCEIENPEAAADDKVLSGLFSPTGETYFSHFGEHNATASIMINMGLTADADVVKLDEGGLDELAAMAIHALFGIFLFLMFGFAFVALVVVLIARLIILWICLALSPLIVLFFVFPDIANFGGGEMDLKDKFLKHLFVPLVIGVVLSIGFTMLNVLYDSESGQWTKQLGPNVEFGQLDTTSVDVAEMTTTLGKDITDFQDLLIAICAVLIIWIGVFAAADQTVASSVTSTIKGAGESVGKVIAK